MPRKQKKYHYLYKTTNLINNKFYVGMHSTDNLEDGYLGSGKYLRNSINKHGKENFKREILEFFENRKDLKEREKNLVNEEFLKDSMCMNLKNGGDGGLIDEEHHKKMRIGGSIFAIKQWQDPFFRKKMTILQSERYKELNEKGLLNSKRFKDKNHTDETKIKIGEKNKINQFGEKNSQFGTCWITNNKNNKKIKKEELNKWLDNGWIKGRI